MQRLDQLLESSGDLAELILQSMPLRALAALGATCRGLHVVLQQAPEALWQARRLPQGWLYAGASWALTPLTQAAAAVCTDFLCADAAAVCTDTSCTDAGSRCARASAAAPYPAGSQRAWLAAAAELREGRHPPGRLHHSGAAARRGG